MLLGPLLDNNPARRVQELLPQLKMRSRAYQVALFEGVVFPLVPGRRVVRDDLLPLWEVRVLDVVVPVDPLEPECLQVARSEIAAFLLDVFCLLAAD